MLHYTEKQSATNLDILALARIKEDLKSKKNGSFGENMKEYTIVEEYKNFYLCVDENGFKECFKKGLYKPDESGKIKVKHPNYGHEGRTPIKINKKFGKMRISYK